VKRCQSERENVIRLNETRVDEIGERLCQQAAAALGAGGASLSVAVDSKQLMVVAATEVGIERLSRSELANQDGPALDAIKSGRGVAVGDLAAESRWESYRRTAHGCGVRSVAAVPMVSHGAVRGVLVVSAATTRSWTVRHLELGQLFADIGSELLDSAASLNQAQGVIEQLRGALDQRAIIEQAKGMIAIGHGVSVDVAFDRLRRHSRNTNTQVRVLARAVVDLGVQIPLPAARECSSASTSSPRRLRSWRSADAVADRVG
jgi:GAF domain-containing protein